MFDFTVGRKAAAARLLADMVYIGRSARSFKTAIGRIWPLEWCGLGLLHQGN